MFGSGNVKRGRTIAVAGTRFIDADMPWIAASGKSVGVVSLLAVKSSAYSAITDTAAAHIRNAANERSAQRCFRPRSPRIR